MPGFVNVISVLMWTAACSALVVHPNQDWKSAIETAEAGTRLELQPGVFTGDCEVSILTRVHLVGVGGSSQTIIDCGGSARHFHVTGADVTFEGITLSHGSAETPSSKGGCVLAEAGAFVSINDCVFSGCRSDSGSGGAIHAHGSKVDATRVLFKDGFALDRAGALSLVLSTASIADSTFTQNNAGGKGGAISAVESELHVSESTIEHNFAVISGGGLSAENSSRIFVSDSIFVSNYVSHLAETTREDFEERMLLSAHVYAPTNLSTLYIDSLSPVLTVSGCDESQVWTTISCAHQVRRGRQR